MKAALGGGVSVDVDTIVEYWLGLDVREEGTLEFWLRIKGIYAL